MDWITGVIIDEAMKLISFGGATLKEGLRRIVNNFPAAASSLDINLRASA